MPPFGAPLKILKETNNTRSGARWYKTGPVAGRAFTPPSRLVPIEGADGTRRQMRRVRVSPDNKYVVVSANQDTGRQARLRVLPRRRRGVGVRARHRQGHAHVPDRRWLRVHRGVSLNVCDRPDGGAVR